MGSSPASSSARDKDGAHDKTKDKEKAKGADTRPAGPDVRDLDANDLPEAEFPGKPRGEFRVFLDSSVHEQIRKHAAEDTGVEVAGVLVGKWKRDADGPYVAVTAAIRGEGVENKLSEVTFTHQTWTKIHERMDKDFADLTIVGWYHTHPNFGIFLSDRDRFIHEHFFAEPGQIAYVVDPVRKEEGIFVWSGGKPRPTPFYWVGTRLHVGAGEEDEEEPSSTKRRMLSGGGSSSASKADRSSDRRARDRDRERDRDRDPDEPPPLSPILVWTTKALWALTLFLFGYLVAGLLAPKDQQRPVIARNVKEPGPTLLEIQQRMGQLALAAAQNAQDSTAATRPADLQRAWTEAARLALACQQALNRFHEVYPLSGLEEDALRRLDARGLLPSEADALKAREEAAKKAATAPSGPGTPGATGAPATKSSAPPAVSPAAPQSSK